MDSENKYGMKAMHTALLTMLEEFDAICVNNNITYSLAFGSMLGAVREHGIIPWDDDVDIIIDRNNYHRLGAILESSSDKFEIEKNNNNSLWLPRLRYKDKEKSDFFDYELTIDLFLIDNVPDSHILAKIKLLMIHTLQGMCKKSMNLKKGNILQKIATFVTYLMGKLFPSSFKYRMYNKVSAMSNSKSTKCCACYNAEYLYCGKQYDKQLLEKVSRVKFDNIAAPISSSYDHYLKILYGDYMTPPNEKDRVPKHS